MSSRRPPEVHRTTVRTRLTWYSVAPVAVISAFIYLFFPARQQSQALDAVAIRARSIAQMTAFTIGPALDFGDWDTVDEAVAAARQNTDLAWLVAVDAAGQQLGAAHQSERFYRTFPDGRHRQDRVTDDGLVYAVATRVAGDEPGRWLCLGLSLQAVNAEVAASRSRIAWICLLVFVAGLGVAYGVSSVVTRPLRHVVETFGQIAAGDLDRRAAVTGGDELGQMAAAFNRMVDTLQAAHVELDRINQELEERVRERTRALEGEMEERRLAEEGRRRLEVELRQAQKMEAVGQLTAGIAHNFNNMLMVIMGNLELAVEDVAPPLRASLQDALAATRRAAQIVRQLVVFARPTPIARAPVDLRAVVIHTVEMCNKTFDRRFELRVDAEPDLPRVRGDWVQLEQVVLNLCLNARDALEASPSPPVIDIRLERTHGERPERSGAHVRLQVEDRGIGMDEATRERIFEPFFTTKEVGKGTGLGLAMVYGIVQEHGGWVECESQPGLGTTFSIYLPVYQDAPAPEGPRRVSPSIPARGDDQTVLVVEDDDMVRSTLRALLERAGYRVREAADGEEGLRALEEKAADLVLLDLSMPRLSGREVLERLARRRDTVKVLVLTGYAVDAEELPGALGVVRKPLRPAELLEEVRAALDRVSA